MPKDVRGNKRIFQGRPGGISIKGKPRIRWLDSVEEHLRKLAERSDGEQKWIGGQCEGNLISSWLYGLFLPNIIIVINNEWKSFKQNKIEWSDPTTNIALILLHARGNQHVLKYSDVRPFSASRISSVTNLQVS